MKKIQFSKISKGILSGLCAPVFGLSLMTTQAQAAVYQVTESTGVDIVQFSYGQKRNASGDAILSGRVTYNFPVQWQYLDDDDFDRIENLAERQNELIFDLGPLDDKEALKAGNPTANDLAWTKRYLASQANSFFYQKIGEVIVLATQNGVTTDIPIFDQPFEGTDEVTRSTVSFANGITDSGILYGSGSAPYFPITVIDEDDEDEEEIHYWVREFSTKGFIYLNDQLISVEAEENTYGGRSAVYDMNEELIAVGSSSLSLNPDAVEFIEKDEESGCRDPENIAPFEACVQSVEPRLYNENAYLWQFDNDGNLISGKDLGFLVEPDEEDERAYQGVAAAINNQGVAVGYSHDWVDSNVTEPDKNQFRRIYAAVFREEGNVGFTDKDEWLQSRAFDINDNGIAVGYMEKFINGVPRTKFYYADINEAEITPVFPQDFFIGSSSVAHSINNNGKIVGEGEVESHNDSPSDPRRRHAFLYDIETDTFTDINKLLTCDSPYTIIEVRHINDKNDIFATALVKGDKLDAKGDPVVDEDGNVVQVDILRAVVLETTGGEIEDCSEVEEKVSRKGASMNFWLLSLFSLFGLARRFKS